ncbi:PEP/pyruvate-binding domain-containing protein, partial [Rhizobium ruizarguesonis]
ILDLTAVLVIGVAGFADDRQPRRHRQSEDAVKAEVRAGISAIEAVTGRHFGSVSPPLLLSVRSGARVSMPGMMDTVLNLGLNDETVKALCHDAGDARFAWDSYRSFI